MKYAEWQKSVPFIGMLTPTISHQRKNAIREEQAEYLTQSSTFLIDSEVPMS